MSKKTQQLVVKVFVILFIVAMVLTSFAGGLLYL